MEKLFLKIIKSYCEENKQINLESDAAKHALSKYISNTISELEDKGISIYSYIEEWE